MFTISDGVCLALGWFITKAILNLMMGYLDILLYSIWPRYKKVKDDMERKKNPVLYYLRHRNDKTD